MVETNVILYKMLSKMYLAYRFEIRRKHRRLRISSDQNPRNFTIILSSY